MQHWIQSDDIVLIGVLISVPSQVQRSSVGVLKVVTDPGS